MSRIIATMSHIKIYYEHITQQSTTI
jgi:hypothetical protein